MTKVEKDNKEIIKVPSALSRIAPKSVSYFIFILWTLITIDGRNVTIGSPSWNRTNVSQSQNLLPYRLAIGP